MNKVKILGVKIDNLSLQEVLEKVNSFFQSKNKHYIVTPNPEFLVDAYKDHNFKEILNYADIAVADGVGLIYAAKFQGQKLQRVSGVDLFGFLCELAEHNNYPIFLLGAARGVAKQTAEVLYQNFPSLNIVGAESGGQFSANGEAADKNLVDRINQAKPKMIFVSLGHVKQEKWIFKNLDQLTSVKVAIGLGGTFDYISGNVPRAPEAIRNLGFEWLYRLITEPKRWKRIFNAVVIFPLLIIKEKIIKNFRKEQNGDKN